MHIDFRRTAAYLCPHCGEFAFADFTLFQLSGKRPITFRCGCEHSELVMLPTDKNNLKMQLYCVMCDAPHEFLLSYRDLMHNPISEFRCPEIMTGLIYVGKSDAVADGLAENQSYIREILSACGLEHTGVNGLAMIKGLDALNALAEDGMLSCECGSETVDLDVTENEIILRCCDCNSTFHISAAQIRDGFFADLSSLTIPKWNNDDERKEHET